ncbi:Ornithine aminotransferase [Brevefilum fermentans]|uniref:ornithine aminotransferase n=2 Tax=Candidatus Brevifilum fermentans TaxID=1986204 RepID=A0A1Y6K407_9CHLR|nr:Ornithine aminotransferase [Brevefilum fermentans]
MLTSEYFINLEDKHGAHNYHPLDVVLVKGEGVWVYDVEGKKYLDCLSAYSAVSQGHNHPKIKQAMIDQLDRLTLTSRAFYNDRLGLLYKKLSDMTGYDKSLPMNSGAEAVETAIKVARKWGYHVKGVPRHKAEIIVADGNFHGRTVTIISFTSTPQYKDDFGPFTPGFPMVEYGDIKAIENAINENTVAIMIEPIQGENGVLLPPEGYLKAVEKLCHEHNILFIADEIQTGLGRTGAFFACDHEGVRPDIMVIGKALSGGFYPVSAVLADESVLGLIVPGDHGSTFGGNPLGASVAIAALDVIEDEKLVENSRVLGQYMMDFLEEIPKKNILEIRGKGLFIGVELKHDFGGARRIAEVLRDKGVLAKETHEHTIRFAPPLVIDKETVDWLLPIVRDTLLMD